MKTAVFLMAALFSGMAAHPAPCETLEALAAPFSWEPAEGEVLESGTLVLSSGPVRDPEGKRSGTFNSIWRLEADGRWRVVFDKG